MSKLAINGILFGLAIATALGNISLKMAADTASPYFNKWFLLGTMIYAATAFGVVAVLRHSTMISASYIYTIISLLLVVVAGMTMFGEQMSTRIILGMLCAFVAIYLLN